MPLFVKSIFEQMKCPTCQSMNQPWSHMMMQNLKCLEVLGWKPLFDHKIQEIEHRLSNMEKTVAKHAKFLHFLCKKTLAASQWEWDVIKSLSELRKKHNGNLCFGVKLRGPIFSVFERSGHSVLLSRFSVEHKSVFCSWCWEIVCHHLRELLNYLSSSGYEAERSKQSASLSRTLNHFVAWVD